MDLVFLGIVRFFYGDYGVVVLVCVGIKNGVENVCFVVVKMFIYIILRIVQNIVIFLKILNCIKIKCVLFVSMVEYYFFLYLYVNVF